MSLTDYGVRHARKAAKLCILNDTEGLELFVQPNGKKKWKFRFTWYGKQRRMTLGCFPALSLKKARDLRDDYNARVAEGVDPRVYRRQSRAAAASAADNTFQLVFERWRDFKALSLEEKRQSTLTQINRIFPRDVLPRIGQISVFDVTRQDLLGVLRRVESRGALSTAEKLRTWFNQLFRYAMVELGLETNPAADLDIVAVPQPPVQHNPYLQMDQMPPFLSRLHHYRGDIPTQLGVRLLLLTGVRTLELRSATPEQFDLERGIWTIPIAVVKQLQRRLRVRNKKKRDIPPYIVPLSTQAIAIVKYLLSIMKPAQRYLLAHRSDINARISENTLNGALKRMGYQDQLTGHGIRATIDTALHELGYNHNWIESQLSHANSDPYNHAKHVEERRRMMQDWADRMDCWEREGLRGDKQEPTPTPALPENRDLRASPEMPAEKPADTPVMTILARKDQRPQPVLTDMQRQRATMLAIFESPHNLALPVFAKLAGKSRDQINREIKNRTLLALNFGNRGHRIPEWQLEPVKQRFVREILAHASEVDSWALHRILSEPLEILAGRVPVDAVTAANLDEVVKAVIDAVHGSAQAAALTERAA